MGCGVTVSHCSGNVFVVLGSVVSGVYMVRTAFVCKASDTVNCVVKVAKYCNTAVIQMHRHVMFDGLPRDA